MQPQVFLALIGCFASVTCRENSKANKLIPNISSSLVNLGNMEISFYINGKPETLQKPKNPESSLHTSLSYITPKHNSNVDEPCPCSNLRDIKDTFLTNPSEVINKILRSNNLFANKNPTSSSLCCDTIEHEDIVFFEITPKQKKTNPTRTNSFPPLIFDTLTPSRHLPSVTPTKSKAFEIYLYPKRKDMVSFESPKPLPRKNSIAKDGIQIVGDKTLKNGVEDINPSKSVKKDLTGLDKIEPKETMKEITQNLKEDSTRLPNTLY